MLAVQGADIIIIVTDNKLGKSMSIYRSDLRYKSSSILT